MTDTVQAGDAPEQSQTPMIARAPEAPAAPAAPTTASERIAVLDVLRGLALYGVLLANTEVFFSGNAFRSRAAAMAHTDTADQVFLFLANVLIDGKAMTLLTFLFGLGFALQLQRAEAAGRSGLVTYLRRLVALMLIGALHVLLLWWGDILWGYAIAGVGLILFRRVRGWKLLAWAVGLALLPQLVLSLPAVTRAIAPLIPAPADGAAFRAKLLAAITGQDRRVLTQLHLQQLYYHVGGIWVWYFPGLVGRFLIGYWAGTTRLFQEADQRLPLFRKLALWGLVVGIPGSSILAVLRLLRRLNFKFPISVFHALSVPSELGTMILCCGYAAVVVLLMQRPAFRRALLLIAPVGQMALTTYLTQSLVCTFLFYGWGLGLAGRVQPARMLPLTLAIFVLQILFAHAWLARCRFGPMEWVWRSLSYGRMQPLLHRRSQAAATKAANL